MKIDRKSLDETTFFEISHDETIGAENVAPRRHQSKARKGPLSHQGGQRPVGLSVPVKRIDLPHLGQRNP